MIIEHDDCTFTWVCDHCHAQTERLPLWGLPEYHDPGWLWDWRRNDRPCPPGVTEDKLFALRGWHNSFQFCSQTCKEAYTKPDDYNGVPYGGIKIKTVLAYMEEYNGTP